MTNKYEELRELVYKIIYPEGDIPKETIHINEIIDGCIEYMEYPIRTELTLQDILQRLKVHKEKCWKKFIMN